MTRRDNQGGFDGGTTRREQKRPRWRGGAGPRGYKREGREVVPTTKTWACWGRAAGFCTV